MRKVFSRLAATTAMVAVLILVNRAVSVPQTEPRPQAAPAFKPVSDVHHLMEGQELHFNAIADLLKDAAAKGRHGKIAMHADLLAELANVNTLNKDKDDYRAWASQVRDLSLQLVAEARKKEAASEDAMKGLVTKISDTCTACHDVYE
ncbi:MAG: hypothetical protein BroJett003_19750 [Planctomycetota bacterium]|nr:MAG: hypothetical protein BroJett003_19750 [Planctomycetota bacterium]